VEVKKAKLDILEDIPGIELEMSGTQIPLTHGDEAPVESGEKWAVNKLLLIGVPLALVALIVCGVLVYYLIHKISPDPQTQADISKTSPQTVRQYPGRTLPETAGKKKNTGSQSLALPEKKTILYLKDFIIDLKDANGNNHVLMCDVAFDIGGEQKHDQLENIEVLRNIIYRTTQARSVVALRSVEERKKLKKELASALGKILGEGSVKNVFFTNYFIM
jgi:flagellar basal body-associated protein FliL